jgi:hypothetical protein
LPLEDGLLQSTLPSRLGEDVEAGARCREAAASDVCPLAGLALGDVLLAQKIGLETMERGALAVANSQPVRV